MASAGPSAPSQDASETERRTQSLDAAGLLSWTYMKTSRRIMRDDVPAIRRAVTNCETEEQKRRFLCRIRAESEASYLAYCRYWPQDVVGGSEVRCSYPLPWCICACQGPVHSCDGCA